ncbi:MAG: hypothetical protein ACREV7_00555 [Steroidobacteraceae bacterium]
MSKETKARASEEPWHLGIGDLLALPDNPAPTAPSGPFVINLRTSSTPIGGVSNALRRFGHLHVYRLERRHEGRPQFLLRVGIVETDLEADAILVTVREEYPGAFKASAGDDDRKAVAATARVATARRATQKSGPKRPEAPTTPQGSPRAAASAAADPQPPFRWNIDELLPELATRLPSMPPAPAPVTSPRPSGSPQGEGQSPAARVAPLEQATARPAPTDVERNPQPSIATPPQISAAEAAPFRVDEGLDCDPNAVTDQVEVLLFTFDKSTFEAEAPQPPVIQAAEPVDPQPASLSSADSDGEGATAAEPAEPLATEAAPPAMALEVADPAPAPAGVTLEPPIESGPADAPQIDRTQTVRALTRLELEDGQSSPWFAIQLMLSEEGIDPHQVPNLSIFAEYRLYAVAGLDQDRRMHALRLGFFSSETAAAAVAGYLATCFDAPSIKRVSAAEHERFEEQRLTARKDVGAEDGHVVIELAGPAPSLLRQAREKLHIPRKHDTPKAGSIWSRWLPSRKS